MKTFEGFCRLHYIGVHRNYRGSIDGIATDSYAVQAEPYRGVFPRELHLPMGDDAKLGRRDAIASPSSNLCQLPTPRKTPQPEFCVANPIVPGRGCKLQHETDYRASFASPLTFTRSYHSDYPYHHANSLVRPLGNRWQHNHEVTLNPKTAPGVVLLLRGDGQILHFRPKPGSATDWISDADIVGLLQKTATGWTYRDRDDAVETFDAAGRRLNRVERGGLALTYSYLPGSDRIASIEDHFGRRLGLTYNAQNLLSEITTPSAEKITYTYADGNLASVTYPDNHSRHYRYTSVTVGGQLEPALLSGLTDENGTLYASWTYDAGALAASSEHAGGADRHRFVYQKDATGKITGSTVTNPLAAVTQVEFQDLLGATRVSSISQPLVPGLTRRFTYHSSNGNLLSQTDFNGNLTTYTYDSRNLESQRVEASGTPDARTTRTDWHPTWRLPLGIAEPLKRTTFTYDATGNLRTRSEQATLDADGSQGFAAPLVGNPRTWTWTYNRVGQVVTADGPRTDVADLTTYSYYADDDPDPGKRGNLASFTNALGHRSDITAYDGNGRPLTLIDPNGLVTTFTYDARGRLTSQSVGDETTVYTYDPSGQLERLTQPDGSFLAYTYDLAHRLTQITDALGNTLTYTLDAAGNRVKEEWRDPAQVLRQSRQRVYDALSRLTRELGALDQLQADYTYDPQGNLSTLSTPHGTGTRRTTQVFDALNRLIRVTDASAGLTQYAYDGQHRLRRVTDPRTLVTRYTVDGLGNATGLDSPDSGVSSRTYDDAGNERSHTDAKGQTTQRHYDALNRLQLTTYADNSRDVFFWDQGNAQLGRLTRIEQRDAADALLTAIDRQYDLHGRLTQETRQIAGVPFTTHYRYSQGRLSGLTTPGGKQIDYTLDVQGRIRDVKLTVAGEVTTLASHITYHPAGAIKQLTNGAGQILTWNQDADGRPASYVLGGQTWQIAYDNASRLASQSNGSVPTQSASYGYDPLDRLTQAVLPSVTHGYGYDATGNRLSQTSGAATRSYTVSPTSNRLSAIAGSQPRAYTYDANGRVKADGAGQTFSYDARGRLTGVTVGGLTTTYRLDPLGQRLRKTGAEDTLYHYDQEGRLISETAPDGTPRKDYVWLGEQPLALIH